MDVRSPFFQNVAAVLVGVMFLNPIVSVAADLTVAAGNAATVGKAGNGVPIVNIAAPNGSGLSHNKFKDYNVGQQGLILNNATERTQNTQLGGIILGNSNLNGRAAGMILNEVTGSNASRLQGYTEVAGKSAHVIVANPHGISCDGCGFINTPRVTLSTGTPIVESGRLDRFDVNGGSIAIEGQGLNASNVDQFDLITRSAKINAELHANKLNIIAGRNVVKADNLSATAKAPDGSDKPLLAIDSSALGGMYAGAIRLVGTEAGVGVKLAGDMAASAGDIQIDANGQLSMARTAASGNLTAKADSVDLRADTYAAGAVHIEAKDTLVLAESLAAGQGVVLLADEVTNRGVVEAGVRPDGTSNNSAALNIRSRNLSNEGTLLASGRLSIGADGIVDNRGGVLAGATTDVQSRSLANEGGRVLAEERLDIATDTLSNQSGLLQSRGDVQLVANTVTNRTGDIVASGKLNAAIQTLDNTEEGRVIAGGAAELEIGTLTNRGGVINAAGPLTLQGNHLDNRDGGLITSEAALTLEVGEADSSNGGEVSAGGDIRVTAKTLTQQKGRLISDGRIELNLQDGTLDNRQGLIKGQTGLAISAVGALANQSGELSTDGNLHIDAKRLVNANAGRIIAGRELDVQSDVLDNHDDGLLSGWEGVTLQGGTLDNSAKGTVSSREGSVSAQLTGALNNGNEGALVGKQALTVVSSEIDNSKGGILSSEADVSLQTTGTLNNAVGGLVNAGGALSIKASDVNNQSGSVRSGADLLLDGRNLDNSNGQLISDQAIALTLTQRLLNTDGQLASGGALLLTAEEVANRGGQLASQSMFKLVTSRLDNSVAGTLAAKGPLRLEVSGLLDNSQDGLIYSQTEAVELQTATLNNQAGTLQGKTGLDIQVSGALDNRSGRLLGERGDVIVEAGSVNNQNGLLTSLAGWVTAAVDGLLDNQGGTIQADNLSLDTGTLDNRGGHVSAIAGDTTIAAGTVNNGAGGLYARDSLTMTGTSLDNHTGKIGAKTIDIGLTGTLNNDAGLIESGSTLALSAGRLSNLNGAIRALGETGVTLVTATDTFDNRTGLLETANTDAQFALGGLLNTNGILRHVGTGSMALASDNAIAAGGTLTTTGDFSLTAASWIHSGVLQARNLTVNVGAFTQTATGKLLASETLKGTGGNWINDGLIASDGALDLQLTGRYSGSGRLTSLGSMSVRAAAMTLGAASRVTAGDFVDLSVVGELINAGRLTAGADLDLSAGRVTNSGTLGAAEQASLKAVSLVNDRGLIFSGSDLAVKADTVTNNYGDIYSLGALTIGGLSTARSILIDNISGSMEAAGDVYLQAQTLKNRREVFSLERTLVESAIGVYCYDCSGDHYTVDYIVRDIYERKITDTTPAAYITAGRDLRLVGGAISNEGSTFAAVRNVDISADTFANQGATGGTIERIRTYNSGYVTDGTVKRFLANYAEPYNRAYNPKYPGYFYRTTSGELRLAIPTFDEYSCTECYPEFSWRDSVTNQSVRIPIYYDYYDGLPVSRYNVEAAKQAQLPDYFAERKPDGDVEIIRGGGSDVQNAVVQAGGNVTIQASQTLTNSVISPGSAIQRGASQVENTSASGTGQPLVVELISHLPPDLAQQQVNPLTLPGFALPQGKNGLFRLNAEAASNVATTDAGSAALIGQPMPQAGTNAGLSRPAGGHRYLIETNPALTDLKQFMGSDYLLGNLGYDPDAAQKRLGDGLYEQRLIREAIVARTGQRYLAGLTSDEAMYRYLMDNAIASKAALNLSLGVSLTAEQVAALTHDIVWMEEQEVMGEKVLVPVLYLAQAEGRLAPNGALIQGRDVALISGSDLTNRGTLRASQNLDVTASNILNAGGAMEANERLQLLATESIRNAQGGLIAGRDVTAIALTGDIVNERTVIRDEVRYGSRHSITDYVSDASTIQASHDLTLAAGRDLINRGSTLQSGGNLDLSAGGDVSLVSAQTQQREARADGRRYLDEHIRQYTGEVVAGGSVTAEAGNDLTVAATTVKAGDDVNLSAGSNVVIAAAANEDHFYSKTKKVKRQKDTVRQQAAQIEAGGDVSIAAMDGLVLSASQIRAGGEAYLVAGGELAVLSAQDEDYSLYEKKSSGSFGRKSYRKDEKTSVRNIGSTITTGGDLTLVSEGDQLYQKARLDSGGDLTLESGGAITFEGVKDLEQESHEKSKNSFVWTSAKGKGKTDETLQQSVLIAKGETVIKAVDGLRIDVRQVNKQTVSQTINAMVKADPELAWIKEAEARGDVDWRRVKEVHDSFKYQSSGLGGGAAIVIAIVVTVLTAGAASALAGAVAQGLTTAGLATGTVAASIGTGVGAFATAHGVQTVISTINHQGNPLAVFKDVHSSDNLKGYATAGVTAGLVAGVVDPAFGGKTNPTNSVTKGFDLSNFNDVLGYTGHAAATGLVQAGVGTAINGGSFSDNLNAALTSQLQGVLQAVAFNAVGGYSADNGWKEGSPQKIAMHALVGGMLSEAAGGTFATGALAAGANEAMVEQLHQLVKHDDNLLLAASQLVGVAAAGVTDGDVQLGADIAKNATSFNFLNHRQVDELAKELVGCRVAADPSTCRSGVEGRYRVLSDELRGTALYSCADAGSVACAQQLDDALAGSQALDALVAQVGLGDEELDILDSFVDSNSADSFTALHADLQAFYRESGAAGGVLLGGAAGLAAAGRTLSAGGAKATGQAGASAPTGGNLVVDNGPKLLTHSPATNFFKGDEAVQHFGKHGSELMGALGRSSYNLKNYLDDANHVIKNGTFVPEMNGYVRLIGGEGSAKYGFVGLDRATGNITTFHVKSVSELARKAPSLGFSK